jgi:hypothetical protein
LKAVRSGGDGDAKVTDLRLMTYGDSVRVHGHGKGLSLHEDREVYVAYVEGVVTANRGPSDAPPRTFKHTFWLVDATTGDLIGWGNLPY